MRAGIILLVCCCVSALACHRAHAQLAQNLTVANAKALSLANAVTADPPGIDSIHFNPAGLALLAARQYQLKVVAGQFVIESGLQRSEELQELLDNSIFDDPVEGGTSSTNRVSVMLPFLGLTELPVLAAPLGGASYTMPQGRYTFATAAYAPMMLGYKRERGDRARYQGNELGVTHLTYFSPSIGMNLTDTLMFGASLTFNYTGVGIDLDMRVPNAIIGAVESLSDITCENGQPVGIWLGLLDLCQGALGPFSDVGNLALEVDQMFNPAIHLGLLWQPTEWFSWGMLYQSKASTTLKGDFKFSYSKDWVDFFHGLNASALGALVALGLPIPKGVESESGQATLKFAIPEHFSTGVSLVVTPQWKINADLKWTGTEAWNEFHIEFDKELDFLSILSLLSPDTVSSGSLTFPRGYESTWSWALGVEYQYNSVLALRAGYEDRPSAIPDNKADLMAPFGAAVLVGVGAEYRMGAHDLLELGAGMLTSSNRIKANQSTNANSTGIDNLIYNPYAGYDISSSVKAYLLELSYHSRF
jgi:long-subunit fatty acid transport protein